MGAPDSLWASMTPYRMTGLKPVAPDHAHTSTAPGIARSAGPGLADDARPWHPDSPMFWFGVLLAATFGFAAASTSLRLGPFRASAGVGKK